MKDARELAHEICKRMPECWHSDDDPVHWGDCDWITERIQSALTAARNAALEDAAQIVANPRFVLRQQVLVEEIRALKSQEPENG